MTLEERRFVIVFKIEISREGKKRQFYLVRTKSKELTRRSNKYSRDVISLIGLLQTRVIM